MIEDSASQGWTKPVVRMNHTTGCAEYVCVADSSGDDAKSIREAYGLELLTDDKQNIGQVYLSLESEWIVWHSAGPGSYDRGDVLAMNASSREVYGVSMGPGMSIRPLLDSGRVVFQYGDLNYSGLAIWDVGSDVVRELNVGPQGGYFLMDFQGDWLAFQVMGSNNTDDDGEWVWNIEEDRGFQLRRAEPTPPRTPPNQSVAGFGVDLNDEYAYYVLSTRVWSGDDYWYEYEIHQVNLSTQGRRIFGAPSGGAGAIEAGDYYAMVSAFDSGAWRMNPLNGSMQHAGLEVSDDCSNPFGKRNWYWQLCTHSRERPHRPYLSHVFYDIENEERFVWTEKEGILTKSAATNGENFVLLGWAEGQDLSHNLLLGDIEDLGSQVEPQGKDA